MSNIQNSSRVLTQFRFGLLLCATMIVSFVFAHISHAKTCLYISSYNKGYEYQDRLDNGLKTGLAGKCTLTTFYMDTKKNPDPQFVKKRALDAKAEIEKLKPDLVLVSNDNAIGEVLVPFFRDSPIPFVFFGLPWSVDRYNLPFKNTAGMINIPAVEDSIKELIKESKSLKTLYYVADENETSRLGGKFYTKLLSKYGLDLKIHFVSKFADWKKFFLEAQTQGDAMIMGNYASISDWNAKEAKEFVEKNIKKMTFAISKWMTPFAVFANVTMPEEHGEFGGLTAIKILEGTDPNKIPVANNKKYEAYVNKRLLTKVPVKLSESFLKRAKVIEE